MGLRRYKWIALLAMYAPFGHAEDIMHHPISEHDYLDEVPRVLTVSRLSQSMADAPSAVTVIDRAMIRESGAVDLPELFRLVPGMYVGVNAGYVYNTNHAVSYHGMTSAYPGSMQVLINGRSVYTPLFGGVKWSELPVALMDIERIEVIRGPNAASYGANAFFATINIITQHPSETSGNTVLATHGNGRNEAFYRHAGKAGDWAYRATVGYRQDDGLGQRNDFKRTRFINAQADYQINPSSNLEFEFGLTDGARGEGDIREDSLIFLPRTAQIDNHYELARWRYSISDTSDFQLQAYHAFDRADDATTSANLRSAAGPILGPLLLNDTITIRNPVETERYDIEAQHNFAVGNKLRFVWGGSVRRDSMYAPHYLGTTKTDYFDLQRLFGHVEWQAHEKLLFNAGAMIEHNDFTGTDISPRVSVNFKPTPNHAFRMGVSTALRTPNYVEEKFNRSIAIPTTAPIPNNTLLLQLYADKGNVDPEKIISREIGYFGKINNLSMDIRLFHDTITDHIRFRDRTDFTAPSGYTLIDPKPSTPQIEDISSGTNLGSAAIDGFEMQTKWQIASSTSLLLNYAYVHIRETQPELRRNFTESMPRNTFSAMLTHKFDQYWDASFMYFQTSDTTQLGDGDPVDLIRKSDLRIARKFMLGNTGGELSLAVENLFNNHYLEFADYNEAERRARLNLKLDF